MQIQEKVFVVTGAGNGMGREIALLLLAKGAKAVAGVDYRAEFLDETAKLAAAGDRFSAHPTDVSDRTAVEALPAAIEALHGPVDGVVNVAGIIQPFAPIAQLSIEQIEHVVGVNFWGTVYVTKAFLPGLLGRPAAKLVNFSSMGALVPVPGQSAYGASKGAVKLFTEGLYAELQGTPVTVSVVFPGGVQTNIAGNSEVPMPTMSEADAARSAALAPTTAVGAATTVVEDGIENDVFRILVGEDAKALDALARQDPTGAITTVAEQMKAIIGL